MSETQNIELKLIHPNRLNPRLAIDIEKLNELSDSIRKVGILQPIVVRPILGGYEVVVGERRYRAAQQAKLEKVPVVIRNFTDEEVIELNLIENVQREDLSVVEKAKACKNLKDKFPRKYPSWERVSEQIGVSLDTIKMWLKTLNLPEEVQKLVAPREVQRVPEGKIDYRTATMVAGRIKDPEKQIQLAKAIVEKRIPQRDVRRIIKEATKEPDMSIEEAVTKVIEEPYELPFRLSHMKPILDGTKTQTSRTGIADPKIKEGTIVHAAVWEPHFADLRIKTIAKKRLKFFNEEDAKREGGYTLEEFKKVWKQLHGDWDGEQTVYVIYFERVR
jgi:ParB family chromosome partitioning protein